MTDFTQFESLKMLMLPSAKSTQPPRSHAMPPGVPAAAQARHDAAPNEAPQPAPVSDPPEAPPGAPAAAQARHDAAPSEAPQPAPVSDPPEAPPGAPASDSPLRHMVPPAHRPVGVIFFECGEWAASCDRLDLRVEQDGDFPAGLPAEAVWIVGCSSQRLAELRREKALEGLCLHRSDWLGPSLGEIADEWGMDESWALVDKAMALSAIADRTVGFADRAAERFARASDRRATHPLLDAPSLAEGLRRVVCEVAPSDAWEELEFEAAFQRGAGATRFMAAYQGHCETARESISREIELRVRVPRLEHALDVLSSPVPADGPWQRDRIFGSSGLTEAEFLRLSAKGRPVLVNACVVPKPDAPHDACLAAWDSAPDAAEPREFYTLEEVAEMLDTHEFLSPRTLTGPGWERPPEANLLAALLESIDSRMLAHVSWSAGLAAAAILDAAMGRAERGGWVDHIEAKDSEPVPPACVWLAARERILTRDRLHAIGRDLGGNAYLGERGGCLRLLAEDSDKLVELASAAWEAGLHMQATAAQHMRDMLGFTPAFESFNWGGCDAAAKLAVLSQQQPEMSMWEHDQIACLEPEMDRLAVLDGPDVQDLWKGLI